MTPAERRSASTASTLWVIRLSVMHILRVRSDEREMKLGSAPLARLKKNSSPMGLDDGPADRQPKAHTFALRGHEGGEQLLCNMLSDTWARVRHSDADHPVFFLPCAAPYLPLRRVCHRLDRITDQVDHNLQIGSASCRERVGQ